MNQALIDRMAILDRLFDAEYGPEHSGIGGEYAGKPDWDVLKPIAPEEAMLFAPTQDMLAIQQQLFVLEKTQTAC